MTGEAQRAIQALGLPQKVTSIADVPELQTFERKMGQKVIDGTGPFSFDLIVDKMNYHQHKLLFLDATDALVTAAQVMTACSEIKIDVDGRNKFKSNPSFLQDLQDYNEQAFGGGSVDGVIVIDHVAKQNQLVQDGYRNVWGTADVSTMTLNIEIADDTTVKKVVLISEVDTRENVPLGAHIEVQPIQINQLTAGEQIITTELLFKEPWGNLGIHVREAECSKANLEVDDKTIHPEIETAVNEMILKSHKRTPMTDTYSIDPSKKGLSSSMLVYPVRSQQLTLTMDNAPSAPYTIYLVKQMFSK